MREYGVTTLCAPPTVWRMLVQESLSDYRSHAREVVSAGEPLNPEVIEQVKAAWGLTIRDGFGQTETTALIGNSARQASSSDRWDGPLPGYQIDLINADGHRRRGRRLCIISPPRVAA